MINLDDDDDKPAGSAHDLLNDWARSKTVDATPPATQPEPAPQPGPLSGLFGSSPPLPPARNPPSPKVAKGLTPEETAKLAAGLKKIVTNINVVAVGASVQMFGRVPAPLDDEEIKLLQMGWEMYLDEIFAKKKIKPVHIVLAANIMIAFTMYVGGKPMEKPKKLEEVAKQAPGNPNPLTAPPRMVKP